MRDKLEMESFTADTNCKIAKPTFLPQKREYYFDLATQDEMKKGDEKIP